MVCNTALPPEEAGGGRYGDDSLELPNFAVGSKNAVRDSDVGRGACQEAEIVGIGIPRLLILDRTQLRDCTAAEDSFRRLDSEFTSILGELPHS